MKTMTKLMVVGALAASLSACVGHPRGSYAGYPDNRTYDNVQGKGSKAYSGAGVRGRGSNIEVYGEVDAGVGYTRTKITR